MVDLMVESGMTLVDTWTKQLESVGGVADMEIDEYMIGFSNEVIARACFGNNYARGSEIFLKLRGLQEHMHKRAVYNGIPILRFGFPHSLLIFT